MKAARAIQRALTNGSRTARKEANPAAEVLEPTGTIPPNGALQAPNFRKFPPLRYAGSYKTFGLPKFRCDCQYTAGFLLMFLHLTEYHGVGGSEALYLLDIATKENEDKMNADARRELEEVRSAVAG